MRHVPTRLELFNCEFSNLAMTTNSFVHSSIGPTTDEANDFVTVNDPHLALVTNIWSYTSICRICRASVDFMRALSKHTKRRSSS